MSNYKLQIGSMIDGIEFEFVGIQITHKMYPTKPNLIVIDGELARRDDNCKFDFKWKIENIKFAIKLVNKGFGLDLETFTSSKSNRSIKCPIKSVVTTSETSVTITNWFSRNLILNTVIAIFSRSGNLSSTFCYLS